MTRSGQDDPRQQNIVGSVAFGGDNKGIVNNVLLDPETTAMLAELSEKAPELAALLTEALDNGIISPDLADALMLAVRHINEDVADALLLAGQNINEGIADALVFAARNINGNVANKFVQVKDELDKTASELDRVVDSLRETVGQASSLHGGSTPEYQLEPAGTAGVATRPSPQSANRWRIGKLICCSAGAGLLVAVILMRFHHGGWAVAAGILMLMPLVAAFLQFVTRR